MYRFCHLIPAFVGITAIVMATQSLAHSYEHNGIQIGHAWAAPSVDSTLNVYFPLNNTNNQPDQLIKATSDASAHVKFVDAHRSAMATIALQPNRPLPMRADGLHLALVGLKHAAKRGDHIPITLTFDHAGTTSIEVYVEKH